MKRYFALLLLALSLFSFVDSINADNKFLLPYECKQKNVTSSVVSLSVEDGVLSPFGSGTFVSSQGLVLTSYHLISSYIEHISDAKHDFLKYGCWAEKMEQETPLFNLQVNQLVDSRDVTNEIVQGTEGLRGVAFTRKINENSEKLIKQEKKGRGIQCKVYSVMGGQKYMLSIYRCFRDVRIVAAPPMSVGKFGGDSDNWRWPRYSADFAVLRVYSNDENQPAKYNKNNRPYSPENYLNLCKTGVKENQEISVVGYPTQTRFYIPSFAVERIVYHDGKTESDIASLRLKYYKSCIDTAPDSLKSYYKMKIASATNTILRTNGEMTSVRLDNVLQERMKRETDLQRWINADNKRVNEYGSNLLKEMQETYAYLTRYNHMDLMFKNIVLGGTKIIPFAGKFEKMMVIDESKRKNKTTAIRSEAKNLKRLAKGFYEIYDGKEDKELMKLLFAYYISNVDSAYQSDELKKMALLNKKDFCDYIDKIYSQSPLHDHNRICNFLDSVSVNGVDELKNDPLYRLALGFYYVQVSKVGREKSYFQNKNMDLYSRYLRALTQMNAGNNMTFDANKTMRISTGRIKGIDIDEVTSLSPFTTLKGMKERSLSNSFNDDYAVLKSFAKAIDKYDVTPYWGKKSPVCNYMSDAITANGSTGSAVVNSKGELVGIHYDRLWNGLSATYYPAASKNRDMIVDVRYILWVLGEYGHSSYILDELKN